MRRAESCIRGMRPLMELEPLSYDEVLALLREWQGETVDAIASLQDRDDDIGPLGVHTRGSLEEGFEQREEWPNAWAFSLGDGGGFWLVEARFSHADRTVPPMPGHRDTVMVTYHGGFTMQLSLMV